ncbi:MAG: Sec-independent protein translocase subunit TatA [Acidothermaceae bacterium]
MDEPWVWAIIVLAAVVLFGGKRLPDAARGMGRSLRIFKAEIKGLDDDQAQQAQQPVQQPAQLAAGYSQPVQQPVQQVAPQPVSAPVAVAPAAPVAPVAPVAPQPVEQPQQQQL